MQTQTYTIDIRPRRQATLPRDLLEKLGVGVGDKLEADVEGKRLVLKAKKQIAIDSFKALQRAFQESGIPESEFQEKIKKDREEYAKKNYPDLFRL